MNKLKLIEFNTEQVIYQYIPENRGDPGEVIVNMMTGEVSVRKRAQNDEFGRYGHNASRRVSEYIERKSLPMDATQAWY